MKESNDLKNKENNKLNNEIEKLKKVKINKDSNTMPKMFQDDENKFFIPYDNKYESHVVKKLTEEYAKTNKYRER